MKTAYTTNGNWDIKKYLEEEKEVANELESGFKEMDAVRIQHVL